MASLWIFGYGSLVWNPDFPFEERIVGYVCGYARRFWQVSANAMDADTWREENDKRKGLTGMQHHRGDNAWDDPIGRDGVPMHMGNPGSET